MGKRQTSFRLGMAGLMVLILLGGISREILCSPQAEGVPVMLAQSQGRARVEAPPQQRHVSGSAVDNGDFEQGDLQNPDRPAGWEPLPETTRAASFLWDETVAYSGRKSLKIIKNQADQVSGVLQQLACPSPERWYQLSAWVKTEDLLTRPGARGGACVTVLFFIPGLEAPLAFESPFVTTASDWQQQKLVFAVPQDCATMKVILGVQGAQGAVWWDKIEVAEIAPKTAARSEAVRPEDLDRYGGYKAIQGRRTGFFHAQQINGRWWLITPEGHGFIAAGLQSMSRKGREAEEIEQVRNVPTQPGTVRERYQLLTQLMEVTASQLGADFQTLFPQEVRQQIKDSVESGSPQAPEQIDEAFRRIGEMVHGTEAQRQWRQASAQRLKDWGFNLVSHNTLFDQVVYDLPASPSLWGFPFIAPEVRVPALIGPRSALPAGIPSETFGFPDVYDPKFRDILEREFSRTSARVKDDPYLLGYFLGNELAWSGNIFTPAVEFSLFDMFIALPPERPGKQAVVDFLRSRYSGDPASFNQAWGTQIRDFPDLMTLTSLGPGRDAARCQQDRSAFLALTAEQYFKINHEVIRRYDPNHLILGVRFMGGQPVSREILEPMGRYVDVVSFNAYEPLPPLEKLTEAYRMHRRPMLITEFSFRAKDSGLPNTLGQGFTLRTQRERGLWYERYVARLLSSPQIVGFTWYKDVDDQPANRGENCNYGLMTVREEPYAELVAKVREVNRRIYGLARTARE
ncbi:MAG: hypothetical protein FJ135_01330 [Deltaproteobacteria bacterium]|nr:hypothetical protein [Deltaproteobacteria bacterium]